ncbi:hypothetical protein [Holospora undulata]|uniref:hypothetical protein n=1 Tax=Holospora undulata TaxID=1169117 RepID=UPI0003A29D38|nr:hypothetical protein [Holospora undulata]
MFCQKIKELKKEDKQIGYSVKVVLLRICQERMGTLIKAIGVMVLMTGGAGHKS